MNKKDRRKRIELADQFPLNPERINIRKSLLRELKGEMCPFQTKLFKELKKWFNYRSFGDEQKSFLRQLVVVFSQDATLKSHFEEWIEKKREVDLLEDEIDKIEDELGINEEKDDE